MSAKRPPSRLKLDAGPADQGAALVEFIARRGGISLEESRVAIERGGAFLRGKRERAAEARIAKGDRVEVVLRERGDLPAVPTALGKERILRLDSQILALDKPAGVTAQEGRAGGESLLDLAAALLASLGEDPRALLVHRLDRGTTGVTVLARTRAAQRALLEEFREGRAEKEYRALVHGKVALDEGEIALPLGADPVAPGRRRVVPGGPGSPGSEEAFTRYRVVERFGEVATLLAGMPRTGRTHQLRVHFQSLGHPLLGDARYGGPQSITRQDGTRQDFARPLLHALSLRLRFPPGSALTLRAPEPADFASALSFLRER